MIWPLATPLKAATYSPAQPRSLALPLALTTISPLFPVNMPTTPQPARIVWRHPIQLLDWYITLRPRLLQSQFDELAQAPLAWVLQRRLLGIASHLQSIVNQFSMCTGHGVIILPFGISRPWKFIVLKLYQLSK